MPACTTRCNPWDEMLEESACVRQPTQAPMNYAKRVVRELRQRRVGCQVTRFTYPLSLPPCRPRMKGHLLCCSCSSLCSEYPQQVQRDAHPDPDISYEA